MERWDEMPLRYRRFSVSGTVEVQSRELPMSSAACGRPGRSH